jgi:hypothetical protein
MEKLASVLATHNINPHRSKQGTHNIHLPQARPPSQRPIIPLLFVITTDVLAAMFAFADRRGAKIPDWYKLFH